MPTIGFHTLGKSFVANNPPMSLFFVIKICYNTLQIYYYFLFVSKNICTMGRQYIVTKLKCIFSLQTCSNKLNFSNNLDILNVATPLWPSVGVKPNTPKVGDLESSGTPECLGFDNKAQNTSH